MSQKMITILLVFAVIITMSLTGYCADNRYKVAILPFDDGSVKNPQFPWDIGKGVADELVTALLSTGSFRLIERDAIDKVMHEQDFGASGRVDANSAAKIGKVLGVDYLVIGKVTEFTFDNKGGGGILPGAGLGLKIKSTKARVAIDARLVHATTAEIDAAVTGRGEKSSTNVGVAYNWNVIAIGSSEFRQTILGQALREAVDQVAKQLAGKGSGAQNSGPASLSGNVADTIGNKVYINIGSRDGVQVGMTFEIHHVLRLVKDPKTGEVIDEVTEPVAEVVVDQVKDKSATCVITRRLSNQYSITINDIVRQK